MADEVRLWQVRTGEGLQAVPRGSLDLESRLQQWLAEDISILDPGLLVIGHEVPTDFGGFIDILCVDEAGDLVIVELKRDKTPREITAQALDYASWVVNLSHDEITAIAEEHLSEPLETEFLRRFGSDLPDTLNGDHRVVIVASVIDASSERIIRYLSGVHGMNINAATFNYFRLADEGEVIARVFLIEPAEAVGPRAGAKRRPKLSYEQLSAKADEAGVLPLYEHAVNAFAVVLRKYATTSGIGFQAPVEGGWKSIVTLTPGDSRPGRLRYRLYKNRYAEVAAVSVEQAEALVPKNRTMYDVGDDEYAGYEGLITETAEIDRLVEPLRSRTTSVERADPRSTAGLLSEPN